VCFNSYPLFHLEEADHLLPGYRTYRTAEVHTLRVEQPTLYSPRIADSDFGSPFLESLDLDPYSESKDPDVVVIFELKC